MLPSVEFKQLNEVLNKTINAIQDGKKEIFEISEKARQEYKSIEEKLKEVQEKITGAIKEVDVLEIKEKLSRNRLSQVSKSFREFGEEEIRKAYDTAKDLQIALTLKRKDEKDLIQQRTELEIRLKDSKEISRRAEVLTSKVGLALEYLSEAASEKLEDIRAKSEMGIRIIKAQEEERQRVSREIHDGPAQAMANVLIKAEYCEKLIDVEPRRAKDEIKLLKEVVKDNLKNLRHIIYDLMPMSLEDLGLKPTITKLVQDFKQETGIEARLVYTEEPNIKLRGVVNLTLFRIIQEGLSNIRKHANATLVVVELFLTNEEIEVRIQDNGLGIQDTCSDITVPKEDSGFGIFAMKERVDLLEGVFNIESEPNQGTKIHVRIPVKSEVYHNV